jgi:hypothetical protein
MAQLRITPEVPENIQSGVASLELDANQSNRPPAISQVPIYSAHQSLQSNRSSGGASSQAPQLPLPDFGTSKGPDMPHFSPFPPIVAKPNVPPTTEEKEQILDNARAPVLNSHDPEMQLAWAQDSLAYVATAQLHEERASVNQTRRPATPSVEHELRVDAMNIVNFLAEQHHPKAEFMRGMWLEFGNFGVRQDKKEAFRCYARAAEKGYSRAEYRMGMQFESTNDPVKALLHYQRGAEAGDSASNYVGFALVVNGRSAMANSLYRDSV